MSKKLMILTLIFCLSGVSLFAQQTRQERINAAKVAYITDRINLTEKEAAAFWPVYNRFEDEKKAITKKYSVKNKKDWMSDSEAEKFMLDRMQMEEEILKLKRDYYWDFKKVIPPSKIAMLKNAEREFKKQLLNRAQNKRQNPNGPRKRRPGGK